MKKHASFSIAGIVLFALAGSAWAVCPEQPNDNGICDTFYVDVFEGDELFLDGPQQIRFPLRLTNDIPDPSIDSIAGMCIALCFTTSNPAANPTIEVSYNNTNVSPQPNLEGSIFRHLPSMDDPQEQNWMMNLGEQGSGQDWDTKVFDLSQGDNFWLALVPTGDEDQLFPGGSRLLVATMTFTLDDTTTLCVDTCWWPPTHGQLFSRSDAVTYIPRDNMPYCAAIVGQCPDQDPNDNGDCDSLNLEVYSSDRYQVSFPAQVRFPMRVTNDIPDPYIDSIAGIVVALDFESSNPAAGALIDPSHNNTNVYPFPDLNQSIFRHLPSMEFPLERNWMMDFAELGTGVDWDTRILDLGGGTHFWMSLVPTGVADQRFPGGERVLTATITFVLNDTTTICMDTCFTPVGRPNVFSRSDAVTYIPRDNMPYCAGVVLSEYGDANGDGVINIADVMYMVNYLYRGGPYPASFEAGDANCDGTHGILDVLILVNYLYKGGRPPGCI
ncbi:MAG: dockerin type I repeat-containing protein [Candidatus Zixiibacteriota bacterium]|nr:MAG: dockerin type I repeat-containing protein [candidate division Zixibacteria bacterium]